MQLIVVEYYDTIHKRWTRAQVSSTSDVAKALSGSEGKRFDDLRKIYRLKTSKEGN